MMKMTFEEAETLFARFPGKYKIDSKTGCWVWTASHNGKYAKIGFWKKLFFAHRVALVWKIGHDNFEQAMHSCDVPLCVNPMHLNPGTRKQNIWDCKNKGRAAVLDRHGRRKINSTQAREIKDLILAGLKNREIADQYGISPAAVTLIKKGRNWKEV